MESAKKASILAYLPSPVAKYGSSSNGDYPSQTTRYKHLSTKKYKLKETRHLSKSYLTGARPGSTEGLHVLRNPSASGSWSSALWWTLCPAGWWWQQEEAASSLARRTRSSLCRVWSGLRLDSSLFEARGCCGREGELDFLVTGENNRVIWLCQGIRELNMRGLGTYFRNQSLWFLA